MKTLLRETWRLWNALALRRSRLRADPRRLSVAITTWNRADRVLALVPILLQDPRIGEVVVRDDASAPADYEKLARGLAPMGARVRLHRNDQNRGPFANKVAAVADCSLEWALLLDSDNHVGKDYLDALFLLPAWSPQVMYCPQFGWPNFDFSLLAGAPLDCHGAAEMTAGPANELMRVFLNTGNYVVPVKEYVRRLAPFATRRVPPDVIFANLIWLHQGGLLHTVPGMAYEHVLHEGSWFRATAQESKTMVKQMATALVSRNPEDLTSLLETLGREQK